MRPLDVKNNKPELKLGIKSSLPAPKSAIALLIALWKATGQKSKCAYSKADSTNIVVGEKVFKQLKTYFSGLISNEGDFKNKINDNPLFKSQMESLIVAFELIWKIGIIKFEDSGKAYNSERTGQVRFPKIICFTLNIDIVNLAIQSDELAIKSILFNWIMGLSIEPIYKSKEIELIKSLTYISEDAIYKLRPDENSEIKFMNSGIYERITESSIRVDISDPIEKAGGLRILHPIISDDLNLFLSKFDQEVGLKNPNEFQEFEEYKERVKNYLSLINISIDEEGGTEEEIVSVAENEIGFPYNRILFGAPGTGKSYILEQDRKTLGANYERVTFHPNYSFAQFVGSYKPRPKKVDESEIITYEYVAGPFLRLLVEAFKNPHSKYLLIIEEINRANAAGVFGDIFQLLDRTPNGISEYGITTSEELRDYLINYHEFSESDVKEIKIPSNLYIWATMNSADQGVFPLDSAFKRRWHFEFVGIDAGSELIKDKIISLKPFGNIKWNLLRTRINERLTQADLNVNEDKLIGPFFISDNELSSNNIDDIFKYKLILYLYEDVLKHRKGKFFSTQYNTISKILEAYDKGENIFEFNIKVETSNTSTAEGTQNSP